MSGCITHSPGEVIGKRAIARRKIALVSPCLPTDQIAREQAKGRAETDPYREVVSRDPQGDTDSYPYHDR